MTLLVVSPDYASHLYPLATLATAWHATGERVVVATGPATAGIVRDFGFERVDLRLGRGSNPGVIRAEDQPKGEDASLRGFFDATRRGAVETLAFQAEARGDDLLWDPVTVARDVQRIVSEVRPDHVIVDHLAFSARLALVSSGVHHADVVLGHPSALTVGDEVYGYPPAFPSAIVPDPAALESSTSSVSECAIPSRRSGIGLSRRSRRAPRRVSTPSPRPATSYCSTTRASCTTLRARSCCRRMPSSARPCAARLCDEQVEAWLSRER